MLPNTSKILEKTQNSPSTMSNENKKTIHNFFAPPDLSASQIASDLQKQYENYTNINKNVNAILNKSSWINPDPDEKENLTQSLKNQIDKGLGEIMLALGVSGKFIICNKI